MTTSNHKNNVPSTRTSDKKSQVKFTASRSNEKTTTEIKKSASSKNNELP
ncbi:hypothetical protein [Flavobacterium piscisymbiosum]|uniref:Uncharacterized protein n=1 Tax=Flavobacterium piscisymbiosum TaxID=2893753 RepID=A0ABS8MJB9_9FLAO|nr:hypothetical protein [Flavobacterium sp. F-30]MCC9065609.1 hypothetical protein [Flavobacterium sp. F-30]